MERKEIFKTVQDVFRDVLDNDDILLNNDTVADDIDEWDSLSHIQLIVAIEKQYKIKFTAREVVGFLNVGEFVDSVINKLAAK